MLKEKCNKIKSKDKKNTEVKNLGADGATSEISKYLHICFSHTHMSYQIIPHLIHQVILYLILPNSTYRIIINFIRQVILYLILPISTYQIILHLIHQVILYFILEISTYQIIIHLIHQVIISLIHKVILYFIIPTVNTPSNSILKSTNFKVLFENKLNPFSLLKIRRRHSQVWRWT